MEPFAPRDIAFHGARLGGAWTLKVYSIVYGDAPLDWAGFEHGIRGAELALPDPDLDAGRPGLGVLIAHQGRTGDYVVLGWWNSENELPLEIWVRRDRTDPWRRAESGESACVWDLEVLWEERQAWIRAMLSADGGGSEAYLADVPARFQEAGRP